MMESKNQSTSAEDKSVKEHEEDIPDNGAQKRSVNPGAAPSHRNVELVHLTNLQKIIDLDL
jgi:hypothetical protein